jgi:hypothetical protein
MFNNFNLEQFNKLLSTKRNSGSVTCSLKDVNSMGDEATKEIIKEQLLEDLSLKTNRIKGNWKEIDKSMAKQILEYILSFDMAYDIELDSKPLADKLSNYFFNQFLSDTKYYTNGDFDNDFGFFRLRSWTPITNSTFDTGVLGIDKNKIGILWAEDND